MKFPQLEWVLYFWNGEISRNKALFQTKSSARGGSYSGILLWNELWKVTLTPAFKKSSIGPTGRRKASGPLGRSNKNVQVKVMSSWSTLRNDMTWLHFYEKVLIFLDFIFIKRPVGRLHSVTMFLARKLEIRPRIYQAVYRESQGLLNWRQILSWE